MWQVIFVPAHMLSHSTIPEKNKGLDLPLALCFTAIQEPQHNLSLSFVTVLLHQAILHKIIYTPTPNKFIQLTQDNLNLLQGEFEKCLSYREFELSKAKLVRKCLEGSWKNKITLSQREVQVIEGLSYWESTVFISFCLQHLNNLEINYVPR